MRTVHVRYGMSLREATRAAELLGCLIDDPGHHGGEMRFRHLLAPAALVTHATRKTASRHHVTWLLKIAGRAEALRSAFGLSRAA